jgi:hypothetical protein
MEKTILAAWDERNHRVHAWLKGLKCRQITAFDLFRGTIKALFDAEDYGVPDPTRITEIDHGDYQGTILFVVAETGYQPSTYWSSAWSYGSCSGCDTILAILGYDHVDTLTPEQVEQFWTVCLHMMQGMRRISGYGLE